MMDFSCLGEPPAEVQIGLDNFEILKIDDREFTIEINAYFIVKWRDKRIEEITSQRQNSTKRRLDCVKNSCINCVCHRILSHFQSKSWLVLIAKVHEEAIDYHFSELGHDSTDWVPVELELVGKLWIPDAEILRLKGFT